MKTHTVTRAWNTEDRQTGEVKHWCVVKGHPFPKLSSEPVSEGMAVVVNGDRVERNVTQGAA